MLDGEGEALSGIHWSGDIINDRNVIGHAGSDPGVLSYLYFDPDKNTGIVLLMNRSDFDDSKHIPKLLDLLFKKAEKFKRKPRTWQSKMEEEPAGTFVNWGRSNQLAMGVGPR